MFVSRMFTLAKQARKGLAQKEENVLKNLFLILALVSCMFTLGFSCACTYLTSVNQSCACPCSHLTSLNQARACPCAHLTSVNQACACPCSHLTSLNQARACPCAHLTSVSQALCLSLCSSHKCEPGFMLVLVLISQV